MSPTGARSPLALIVASDRARLAFARNQPEDTLEWLRQAAIAHLAG